MLDLKPGTVFEVDKVPCDYVSFLENPDNRPIAFCTGHPQFELRIGGKVEDIKVYCMKDQFYDIVAQDKMLHVCLELKTGRLTSYSDGSVKKFVLKTNAYQLMQIS